MSLNGEVSLLACEWRGKSIEGVRERRNVLVEEGKVADEVDVV
jgi:hypothetical protein